MPPKKILIIHLSRLGDMIQSLPALRLLKEDCPECEITHLGIEEFCIPLKGIPWIDKLVTIRSSDVRDFFSEDKDIDIDAFERLFHNNAELNAEYDLLVNLTHTRGSSYFSERIKAKDKKGRLFSKANEFVMAGKWGKYLFAAARNRKENLLNLVDLYIGMVGVKNRPVTCCLPANAETDRICLSRLMEHGFSPGRVAIGFQLGASKSLRTWPAEHFCKLGEFLCGQLDAQIVLFGSKNERVLADQFRESATFSFIDLIGTTTLSSLPSFLKHMNVLVSHDTGPMHIAAAVGTKVVGIFMSTAYFRITGPYGCGHIVIQSNYPCAPCLDSTVCSQPLCGKSISPETALRGVRLALGLEGGPTDGSNSASFYLSGFDKNGTLLYKGLDEKKDGFLPWLRSRHDSNAQVSQRLWSEWLDLKSDSDMLQYAESDEMAEILQDYRNACLSYERLYSQGEEQCENIITEFHKDKPSLEVVQAMIARIEHVEQEIKYLESPITILKEIQELYSAETEYCNFPRLAHELLNKYNQLKMIISCFQKKLD